METLPPCSDARPLFEAMAGRRAVDLKWWDGNATLSEGAAHLSLQLASNVVTRLYAKIAATCCVLLLSDHGERVSYSYESARVSADGPKHPSRRPVGYQRLGPQRHKGDIELWIVKIVKVDSLVQPGTRAIDLTVAITSKLEP